MPCCPPLSTQENTEAEQSKHSQTNTLRIRFGLSRTVIFITSVRIYKIGTFAWVGSPFKRGTHATTAPDFDHYTKLWSNKYPAKSKAIWSLGHFKI